MSNESPRVDILQETEEYNFKDLFRVIRARLQYRRFDGTMTPPLTRICFERGDSVGVLLHDPKIDSVLLVRQFRYPAYTSLRRGQERLASMRQAWILEIVAGVHEFERTAQDMARQELQEETGYSVSGDLKHIATIFPSPGGSSERIHLFVGQFDSQSRTGNGGGNASEGEDTQVEILPLAEAMNMLARGEICDAKTIIALQHLALRNQASASVGS
jgi:ADP-ribose pyrophosphatase